jgi:hypothetical protein
MSRNSFSIRSVYRWITNPWRSLPDFIIVGTQKGGTSSLYASLCLHPQIRPVIEKELHFFDLQFHRGKSWYQAQFPLRSSRLHSFGVKHPPAISGEASPYYLFHPHVPKRILTLIPQAKIIILLRNPIDRAYSHYHHNVRKQRESLSFEEAIRQEPSRLHHEFDRMMQDDCYLSHAHQHFSYLARGIYIEQIRRFEAVFPKNQMLILQSECLFARPEQTYQDVIAFLGVDAWSPKRFKPRNVNSYSQIAPSTREQLRDHFEPHNQLLYDHLGRDFGWS